MICLYVDDLIYIGSNYRLNYTFKNSMMQEFKKKDLSLMHYILGLEVYQVDSQFCIA